MEAACRAAASAARRPSPSEGDLAVTGVGDGGPDRRREVVGHDRLEQRGEGPAAALVRAALALGRPQALVRARPP